MGLFWFSPISNQPKRRTMKPIKNLNLLVLIRVKQIDKKRKLESVGHPGLRANQLEATCSPFNPLTVLRKGLTELH